MLQSLRRSIWFGLFCLTLASRAASAQQVHELSYRDRLYAAVAVGQDLIVVGHPGLMLHSGDLGKTFTRVPIPTRDALFGIAFNAAGFGAAVGRSGLVLLSEDKGKTWTKVEAKVAGEDAAHLFAIDVLPDGTLVAVGEFGALLRSVDRGKTWTRQKFSIELPNTEDAVEELNNVEEAQLTSVHFIDAQHGFISGDYGLVLESTDAGQTWKRQNTRAEGLLFSLAIAGPGHLIAAGGDGIVIETRDGGASWKKLPTNTGEHLYGVWASGDRTLVVGANGVILRREGDQPLKPVATDLHTWLISAAFVDAQHGVLVGGRGYVVASDDGGQHFKRIFGE
ncbi:MAG TPA: YCF48-related protein [Polyangiales bacterium]|nr:YCF48-related protein [Polyangiales bacterium]